MCAIGRYDTTRKPSVGKPNATRRLSFAQHTFVWSSITPFGAPVVPDV